MKRNGLRVLIKLFFADRFFIFLNNKNMLGGSVRRFFDVEKKLWVRSNCGCIQLPFTDNIFGLYQIFGLCTNCNCFIIWEYRVFGHHWELPNAIGKLH